MKFLCDNCKAKYQIADDKVAGKTVRMKCRKCGNLIEVKAAVTETSVAKSFPVEDGGDKTTVGPPPGMSPKAPAAQKTASPLASAARPADKRPSDAPSALAGAFQRTVQRDETSAQRSLRELQAADQWYVAINGVPVGPIRMSELRRKAAVGAVTEDSLVWQEGLEEWRPLRTYPELVEAVRDALAGGRISLTPAPAPSGGDVVQSRPVAPAPHRGAAAAAALTPQPRPAQPSNVIPITSRLATAEKLEEAPDPFAPKPEPDPMPVLGAPLAASASGAIATPPPPVLGIEPKRSPPWIPIAMVVLAAAFGITAAYALFFRPVPQAPAPVVIVSAAAPNPTAPTTTPTATETVATNTPPETTAGSSPTGPRPTGGGPKPTATTTSTKVVDPSIAALLGNGPATGPTVGGGGGQGPGGSLTSDQIEAVVRNHQTGVKRTCWERSNSQVGAVNVTAHLTIGPTGTVTDSSADGNDPIVSKCIENQVRTWQFPPTGSTSQVNIPFHFLRQ